MRKCTQQTFFYLMILFLISACSEEPIDESTFGTLTGKVVAKGDNTPLPNVKISSTPVSTTVFTDAEGNFEIGEVQSGEYSIQAELSDFKTAFEAANILEGKTVNIVFELDSLEVNNLVPLTPMLLFPEDGATNIGTQAEFAWSSSQNDDDDINYTLELRNGATNEIETFGDLKDTTLLVDNLAIGKNYFWQVTASDGVNTSVKSPLAGFSTDGGTSNRFLYVRDIAGNNIIFSGGEPVGNDDEELNQNELQLTPSNTNSYRPKKDNTVNKIAFLRSVGAETHIFTINTDGTGLTQVTEAVPVAGFRQEEVEFTWYDNGAKLYYPSFNKLYSINADGSGLEVVYSTAMGVLISEVAVNPANDLVALKTNNLDGYNARIVVVDVDSDSEVEVVSNGQNGGMGGLDYSADGNRLLFTRDVSGVENAEYRQLDSRVFEYNLTDNSTSEIDTIKESGTNDLDPKYAPDDGAIIFVNTSNDGISEKRIYRTVDNNSNNIRKEPLFTDAFMPDWE
ncbi:carboxypeptidase-like regulatory domain-containing protein [Maribacter sp.]